MGVSQNLGYPGVPIIRIIVFRGPIFGSPYFGTLPDIPGFHIIFHLLSHVFDSSCSAENPKASK